MNRQPYYLDSNQEFPYEITYCLVRLFQKEINFIHFTRANLEILQEDPNYCIYNTFKQINRTEDHYISEQILRNFLERNSTFFIDDDIKTIIRKFDKDKDGKISYREFLDAMLVYGGQPNIIKNKRSLSNEPSARKKVSISTENQYSSPIPKHRAELRFTSASTKMTSTKKKPMEYLAELFSKRLDYDNKLETAKKEIKKRGDYNARKAFEYFAENDEKAVCHAELVNNVWPEIIKISLKKILDFGVKE